jgi:hypothetical protein
MSTTIGRELEALERMTPRQLREKYAEVFGEQTNSGNKRWLVKRIAWRMQSAAEGDLSERARRRAEELASDADLRMNAPKLAALSGTHTATKVIAPRSDDRLPPPGSIITRPYKGRDLQVRVLATGFEYDGRVYPSLSAVAKAITGSHCNGYLFFRLTGGDE